MTDEDPLGVDEWLLGSADDHMRRILEDEEDEAMRELLWLAAMEREEDMPSLVGEWPEDEGGE